MKGATMLATLQWLGVVPSYSRPHVSDDNAYVEALMRTLKYRPEHPPTPFDSLEQAREWMTGFQRWYNREHICTVPFGSLLLTLAILARTAKSSSGRRKSMKPPTSSDLLAGLEESRETGNRSKWSN